MTIESILVAFVLLAALLPLLAQLRRGVPRTAGLLAVLVLVPAAATWAVRWTDHARPDPAELERPTEVSQDGYVSSRSCQACHPREYLTWHASYHRTMTQYATPEAVVPSFDGVELEDELGTYRLEQRGDEYWAEMPDPRWGGRPDERPRVWKRIVMTTGSHHYQAYWFPSGFSRQVWIFPFIFLFDDQRWIPRGAAFLGPEDKTKDILGIWNKSCVNCHSTNGKPRVHVEETMDTRVSEMGISCEACHGPGQEHVATHRNPGRRYGHYLADEADGSIVQPERLTSRLSSQVCGRCHGIIRQENIDRVRDWQEHGFRFRPGQELDSSLLLVRAGDERVRQILAEQYPSYKLEWQFWSDGMVRVSGREFNGVVETPCYDRGTMSCLSCHALHPASDDGRELREWATDQLRPGMDGDEACLQCHDEYRADLQAHTLHDPAGSGSRCYNCHMPHTTYGLLGAIRSHQVDSPSVWASLETGRPNACNQCHLDRTMAWSADHLGQWYGQPQPEMTEDERTIAASVLWSVRGDAGQRALMAWSFGWDEAREASGWVWMVPYLSQLLDDPYEAVRYIAERSLRELPGYENLEYDFLAPAEQRQAAAYRAMAIWAGQREERERENAAEVLMPRPGVLRRETFTRLLAQRDDREVQLHE